MTKVILICGKICSGKTRYAKAAIKSNAAVLLSSDEITLSMFGKYGGQEHGAVVDKLQAYLFEKSLEIVDVGVNVILDWGFWKREDREKAITFYKKHHIHFEWHYIDSSDEVLRKNLTKRNREINEGQTPSYYFPEELIIWFWDMFETPERDEMDVWVDNRIK